MKIKTVLALVISTLLVASLSFAAPIGKFEVKTAEGKAFKTDDLKGKKTFLILVQTACGQCRNELKELKANFDEVKKAGDIFVVLVDVDSERALASYQKFGFEWPVIFDPDFKIGAATGATATPTTVVIEKDLNIKELHTGYQTGTLTEIFK